MSTRRSLPRDSLISDYRAMKNIDAASDENRVLTALESNDEFLPMLRKILDKAARKVTLKPQPALIHNAFARTIVSIILECHAHASIYSDLNTHKAETKRHFDELNAAVDLLIKHFSRPMLQTSDGEESQLQREHNSHVRSSRAELTWMKAVAEDGLQWGAAAFDCVFPASQKKAGVNSEAVAFVRMLSTGVTRTLLQPHHALVAVVAEAVYPDTRASGWDGEAVREVLKLVKRRTNRNRGEAG